MQTSTIQATCDWVLCHSCGVPNAKIAQTCAVCGSQTRQPDEFLVHGRPFDQRGRNHTSEYSNKSGAEYCISNCSDESWHDQKGVIVNQVESQHHANPAFATSDNSSFEDSYNSDESDTVSTRQNCFPRKCCSVQKNPSFGDETETSDYVVDTSEPMNHDGAYQEETTDQTNNESKNAKISLLLDNIAEAKENKLALSCFTLWKNYSKQRYKKQLWSKHLARLLQKHEATNRLIVTMRSFSRWKQNASEITSNQLAERLFRFASNQRECAHLARYFQQWRIHTLQTTQLKLLKQANGDPSSLSWYTKHENVSAHRKQNSVEQPFTRQHQLTHIADLQNSILRPYFTAWRNQVSYDTHYIQLNTVIHKQRMSTLSKRSIFLQWKMLVLHKSKANVELSCSVQQVKSQLAAVQSILRTAHRKFMRCHWRKWKQFTLNQRRRLAVMHKIHSNIRNRLDAKFHQCFSRWKLNSTVESLAETNLINEDMWNVRVTHTQAASRIVLSQAIRKLIHSVGWIQVAHSLHKWKTIVQNELSVSNRFARYRYYWLAKRMQSKCFSHWSLACTRSKSRRLALTRLNAVTNANSSDSVTRLACFLHWASIARNSILYRKANDHRKAITDLQQLIASSQQKTTLKRQVFHGWRMHTRQSKALSLFASRNLATRRKTLKSMLFRSWIVFLNIRKKTGEVFRRIQMKQNMKNLKFSFDRLKYFIAQRNFQRIAIRRVLQHKFMRQEINSKVLIQNAFGQLHANTINKKRRCAALAQISHRIYFPGMTKCWNRWVRATHENREICMEQYFRLCILFKSERFRQSSALRERFLVWKQICIDDRRVDTVRSGIIKRFLTTVRKVNLKLHFRQWCNYTNLVSTQFLVANHRFTRNSELKLKRILWSCFGTWKLLTTKHSLQRTQQLRGLKQVEHVLRISHNRWTKYTSFQAWNRFVSAQRELKQSQFYNGILILRNCIRTRKLKYDLDRITIKHAFMSWQVYSLRIGTSLLLSKCQNSECTSQKVEHCGHHRNGVECITSTEESQGTIRNRVPIDRGSRKLASTGNDIYCETGLNRSVTTDKCAFMEHSSNTAHSSAGGKFGTGDSVDLKTSNGVLGIQHHCPQTISQDVSTTFENLNSDKYGIQHTRLMLFRSILRLQHQRKLRQYFARWRVLAEFNNTNSNMDCNVPNGLGSSASNLTRVKLLRMRTLLLNSLVKRRSMNQCLQAMGLWKSHTLEHRYETALTHCKQSVQVLLGNFTLLGTMWRTWREYTCKIQSKRRAMQSAISLMLRNSRRSKLRLCFTIWERYHERHHERKRSSLNSTHYTRQDDVYSCSDTRSNLREKFNFQLVKPKQHIESRGLETNAFSKQLMVWYRRSKERIVVQYTFSIWKQCRWKSRAKVWAMRIMLVTMKSCLVRQRDEYLNLAFAFRYWASRAQYCKLQTNHCQLRSMVMRLRLSQKLRNGSIDTTKI